MTVNKCELLAQNAKNYNMHSAGVVSDEELRQHAVQIMKSNKHNRVIMHSRDQVPDTAAHSLESVSPDWLLELDVVLVQYWETGEFPDDIDEEWIDEMIARVTAEELEEMRVAHQRKKAAKRAKKAAKLGHKDVKEKNTCNN